MQRSAGGAGCLYCVTHFDLTTLAVPVKGAAWGLISAVCFAFYTVSPRKLMQKYHVLTITGWGMTIGGVVMLLFFRPWQIQGVQFSGKLFLLWPASSSWVRCSPSACSSPGAASWAAW